jgi:hypothetical protein
MVIIIICSRFGWPLLIHMCVWFGSIHTGCDGYWRGAMCYILKSTNALVSYVHYMNSSVWGLRPDIYHCQTVAGWLMWGALSDGMTGPSFTIAPGPHQRSHYRVRLPWDSSPYFTVSDSRLLFSSPPTTRRVTVEVFDSASTRESHSSDTLLPFYNHERTEYKSPCRIINSPLLLCLLSRERVC